MSKLLHSRTFRHNLFKWLTMYVFTLLLVTAVVTYSKYISEKAVSGNAIPAKFILSVAEGDICSTTSPDLCNLDSYKPYDTIEYKFSVDTKELEVKTLLNINVNIINSDFEIVSFKDEDNNTELTVDNRTSPKTVTSGTNLSIEYKPTDNGIKLLDVIQPASTDIKNYSIKIKLKNPNYATSYEIDDNVSIGYSIKQITD